MPATRRRNIKKRQRGTLRAASLTHSAFHGGGRPTTRSIREPHSALPGSWLRLQFTVNPKDRNAWHVSELFSWFSPPWWRPRNFAPREPRNRQLTERRSADDARPADHALPKTDAQWRRVLTPEQYRVTRHKGTEAPFSGQYYKTDAQGVYRCVCCGEPLFSSDTKFDAHCGWPSFSKPIDSEHVKFVADHSHGMHRIEVQCRKCGARLGHVFDDGPQPTGQRFCINSVSLKLEPKAAAAASQPGAASTGGAASK